MNLETLRRLMMSGASSYTQNPGLLPVLTFPPDLEDTIFAHTQRIGQGHFEMVWPSVRMFDGEPHTLDNGSFDVFYVMTELEREDPYNAAFTPLHEFIIAVEKYV